MPQPEGPLDAELTHDKKCAGLAIDDLVTSTKHDLRRLRAKLEDAVGVYTLFADSKTTGLELVDMSTWARADDFFGSADAAASLMGRGGAPLPKGKMRRRPLSLKALE